MQKLIKKFDPVLKYGLAAILIIVPLFPKFPFIRIPGTYVSIRIEDFLIAFLAIIYAIYFFKELPKLLKNKLEFSMLVFILVGLVSLISGIFLTQTVAPMIGLLNWLRRIEYFVPFVMGLLYFKNKGSTDLEFFFKVILIVIFIAFIYGFGQKNLSWPVIITQNEEYAKGVALRWIAGSHINSTFAGHYDLATLLVFLMPFVVSFFFLLKGLWTRVTLGAVALSGLWLLTNAVSRISIVAYLLAVFVTLILVKKYKGVVVTLTISMIFFLLSGALLARYTQIINVTYQKIKSQVKIMYNFVPNVIYAAGESGLPVRVNQANIPKSTVSVFEDRSMSIRLNVEWPRAIRAFKKNPILGTGYSSITLATDNDFLRLMGEVGALGLISFVMIFYSLGLLIKKILPKLNNLRDIERGFAASYIGGLTGVLLNSVFIDIFEASKFAIIFFLMTGIFVSFARNKLYAQNN